MTAAIDRFADFSGVSVAYLSSMKGADFIGCQFLPSSNLNTIYIYIYIYTFITATFLAPDYAAIFVLWFISVIYLELKLTKTHWDL